jgi:Cyclic phosphodiesterase-like protein
MLSRRIYNSSNSHRHRWLEVLRWFLCLALLCAYTATALMNRRGFLFWQTTTTTLASATTAASIGGAASANGVGITDRGSSNNNDNSNDNDDDDYYVFWLMPVASDAAALDKLVHELAARHGTVPFAPHVTLCPPVPSSNIPHPTDTLNALTERPTATLVLRNSNGGIHPDFGSTYTQSVFVRLRATDPSNGYDLKDLYQRCVELSGAPEEGRDPKEDNFPHLSVMYYPDPDRETRRAIAQSVQVPATVAFDAVQLVRIHLPVVDSAGVQAWKVVGVQQFHD